MAGYDGKRSVPHRVAQPTGAANQSVLADPHSPQIANRHGSRQAPRKLAYKAIIFSGHCRGSFALISPLPPASVPSIIAWTTNRLTLSPESQTSAKTPRLPPPLRASALKLTASTFRSPLPIGNAPQVSSPYKRRRLSAPVLPGISRRGSRRARPSVTAAPAPAYHTGTVPFWSLRAANPAPVLRGSPQDLWPTLVTPHWKFGCNPQNTKGNSPITAPPNSSNRLSHGPPLSPQMPNDPIPKSGTIPAARGSLRSADKIYLYPPPAKSTFRPSPTSNAL